jgi:surface antigen
MLIGNTINAKLVSQQKSKLKSTSFKANETGNPGQSLFNNINLTPTTPIASASVTAPVQTTVQPQAQPQQVVFKEKKQNNGIDTDRTLLYAALAVSSVAAVAAITGGLSLKKAISKGDVTKLVDGLSNKFDSQIDELRKSIDAIAPNAKDAANAAVKSSVMSKGFVAALAGALGVGGAVVLTKDDQNKLDDTSKKALADVNDAAGQIGAKIKYTQQIGETARDRALGSTALYTRPVMGLNLANKYEVDKRPVAYAKALKTMRTFADDRIRHKDKSNDIGINSTIWSMTSEFDPIKVGGLGVVPVHVQRNLMNKFNVDMPVFIPMYLNNGQSGYKAVYDNKTGKMNEEFTFGNKTYPLERVIGFDVKKYVDGKPVNQEVKLYVSEEKDHTKLYFVKTDSSFEGGIYQSTSVNDEKEKFALFSRAIYELAKYKLDPKSATGIKIYNEEKLNELKAPDGMFLNDWHAAPIAAISRYCSVLKH